MKKSARRRLRRMAFALCAACFLLCGGLLTRYFLQTLHTQRQVGALREVLTEAAQSPSPGAAGEEIQELPASPPGFDSLALRNGDFVGWISIEGTAVDYPVMQPPPDAPEYYLRRGFDRQYDFNGLPFVDARCSLDPRCDNVIVYGHSIRSGVMFSDLLSYRKKSYWEAHPTVRFDTLYGEAAYQIAAAFPYDAASDADAFKPHGTLNFDDEAQFDRYVGQVLACAYYDTGVELTFGDRLLLLVTCDRRALQSGRMILLAKQTA